MRPHVECPACNGTGAVADESTGKPAECPECDGQCSVETNYTCQVCGEAMLEQYGVCSLCRVEDPQRAVEIERSERARLLREREQEQNRVNR